MAKKQAVTSTLMKVQIMTKVENGYLGKEENRRFGLVKENRPIRKSDVDGFIQTIQNEIYDEDTQTIVTIEASELIGKYNIVDLEGNEIAEKDAHEYLIVLDGQHRVIAFSKLNSIRKDEDKLRIPNVHIKRNLKDIRKYLADINTVGHSWNATDKICVAAISTGNKILDKINELIKEGYNASAAAQICAGRRLNHKEIKKILETGDTSCLPSESSAVERADKFLITAIGINGMTPKILTKRYFIKGFNTFAKATSEDKAFEALQKLTIKDFETTKEDDEFVGKLKDALIA